MAPSIELTPGTYRRLERRIRRFGETPEDVVREMLDELEGQSRSEEKTAPGEILPETAYWGPILKIIEEAGGAAKATDVIDALGARLGDRLTVADREPLKMGEVRWRNRARFARLRMRERGLLSSDSPRGVWEATEAGRRYLAAAEEQPAEA